MPPRLFAGRAPITPPTSDSESDSKSDSDVEPERRAPVPRRRRFVARVVTEAKPEEPNLPDVTPAKGFVRVKELEQHQAAQTAERPSCPQQRPRSPPVIPQPASPSSKSSSSESSESDSEGPPSPPPEPAPVLSFKPVFIKPKAKDAPDTSRQDSRALERKKEARQLVSAVLEEEEASRRIERHVDLPDDTDYEEDKAREEALWRVREMRRVLRDRESEKAWRNRGMVEKVSTATDGQDREKRDASQVEKTPESAGREKDPRQLGRAGPFFADRGEDGRFTEDIYNRELEEGRGGLSGLRVGRDGGRSGRTKFAGLAKEDTAGKLAQELKRDSELSAALNEASRRR